MSKKTDAAAWKEFFDAIDVDKSGTVDTKELENLLKQIGFKGEEADGLSKDIMKECDANADNKITWAEFKKAMEKATAQ